MKDPKERLATLELDLKRARRYAMNPADFVYWLETIRTLEIDIAKLKELIGDKPE